MFSLQLVMKFQAVSEAPVVSSSELYSVMAGQHSPVRGQNMTLTLSDVTFRLPSALSDLVESSSWENDSMSRNTFTSKYKLQEMTNQHCLQSHMTSFKNNPFTSHEKTKVNYFIF